MLDWGLNASVTGEGGVLDWGLNASVTGGYRGTRLGTKCICDWGREGYKTGRERC